MYVKGLEPGGEAWDGAASPIEVLDEKVPLTLQAMFEERLKGKGFGIHEIAIFAATIEHLIHDEAAKRLKASYDANSFPVHERLDKESIEQVIDTYMVFFLGKNASSTTRYWKAEILNFYPAWPQSQKFTREVQQSITGSNAASPDFAGGMLTFNGSAQVIEAISESYGRWQDSECHNLKAALLKFEHAGTGRVLLKNFYSDAFGGSWQFTESVAYLRELGALDETDPIHKSVIIPNYINSPSNCLASSTFYSICCLNECEGLLGHLEKEIGEPDGTVAKVLELVSNLPSSTLPTPRSISSDLKGLLEEVASHHRGRIPLHGRLFGQWMHHAYPRECPYPHKAGTTKPMTPDEWTDENGMDALSASATDLLEIAAVTGNATSSARAPMWTVDEELIVSATSSNHYQGFSRSVVLLAFASFSIGFARMHSPTLASAFVSKQMLPMAHKSHYC